VTFLLLLVVGTALCALLMYVGITAESSGHKGLALLGISAVFLVGGFFWAPLWVGVVLGPLFWVLLRPRTGKDVRWDKMHPESQELTPEQRQAAQHQLAKGRCPSCGAKNPSDIDRCHVCGSYLGVA
jgi:ribosomal protein L40E